MEKNAEIGHLGNRVPFLISIEFNIIYIMRINGFPLYLVQVGKYAHVDSRGYYPLLYQLVSCK